MKFAFIYHSGNVPDDQYAANCEQLWKWIDALKQKGIETAGLASNNGGKTVSAGSVKDYEGDTFAISIIEADSIEAAIELTRDWPELRYGGKIDILQAYS